jgi:hypothetical protein
MLCAHEARDILFNYEKGTGRIENLLFSIEIQTQKIGFKLPLNWRKTQKVMQEQKIRRADEEDYCYRVAWRILRDWVAVQMALIEIGQASLEQIFLPYGLDKNGQTFYETFQKSYLLKSGV